MCIIPVRHKVKELIELVQDDDRLKQERKRAKKNRDKYKGVSSEAFSRGYSKLKDAVVLSWRAKKRARVYKYPVFVPVKILQSNNHAPFLMIQYFWGGKGEDFGRLRSGVIISAFCLQSLMWNWGAPELEGLKVLKVKF